MPSLALCGDYRFWKDPDATIEDAMEFLCKYGNPRVAKNDGGWHARVDMFVTGKGVEFEIRSEYKHQKPIQALQLCAERLEATLKKLEEENRA